VVKDGFGVTTERRHAEPVLHHDADSRDAPASVHNSHLGIDAQTNLAVIQAPESGNHARTREWHECCIFAEFIRAEHKKPV
jgi:hypothetical protein